MKRPLRQLFVTCAGRWQLLKCKILLDLLEEGLLLDSSLSIHFKQVDSGNTCTAYNQWMFRNPKQSNAHGEIRILCPERKVCT